MTAKFDENQSLNNLIMNEIGVTMFRHCLDGVLDCFPKFCQEVFEMVRFLS